MWYIITSPWHLLQTSYSRNMDILCRYRNLTDCTYNMSEMKNDKSCNFPLINTFFCALQDFEIFPGFGDCFCWVLWDFSTGFIATCLSLPRLGQTLIYSYKKRTLLDWQSGIHVVFNALENSKTERGGIEFCRSRKIISVGCLRRDWQLVGS